MRKADMYLSWDRYEAALLRFRGFIAAGRPLGLDDSNEMGNKHTHCSWGLCEAGEVYGKESWPDAADHLWPEEFVAHGRIAPKHQDNEQWCPFDRRTLLAGVRNKSEYDLGTWGCFYQCKIFSPLKHETKPTREEALALYDVQIERVRVRRER